MEEPSRNMNSEVDINVLVGIYNQKISVLTNQNILLEAKLQSLMKDFEEERNSWMISTGESMTTPVKTKSKSKTEDYQQSEVG